LSRLFDKYEQENGTGTAFGKLSEKDLIRHAIRSLRGCVSGKVELSTKNVSIGVVGVDRKFEIIENDALQAMFDEAIVEQEETKEETAEEVTMTDATTGDE
jgi:20S proteasome alpha/beta subunit